MIYELSYPSYTTIKSQHKWHILYLSDLIPAIYRLDWIWSEKWTHVTSVIGVPDSLATY